MSGETEKKLAIVFWNPGEPYTRAATTLHEIDGNVHPEKLKRAEGLAISDFFQKRNIHVAVAMEVFPDFIVPRPASEGADFGATPDGGFWLKETYRKPSLREYSWDSLSLCSLPMDKQGLQALANMCHLRVDAFEFDRFQDAQPKFYLSVIPEQK